MEGLQHKSHHSWSLKQDLLSLFLWVSVVVGAGSWTLGCRGSGPLTASAGWLQWGRREVGAQCLLFFLSSICWQRACSLGSRAPISLDIIMWLRGRADWFHFPEMKGISCMTATQQPWQPRFWAPWLPSPDGWAGTRWRGRSGVCGQGLRGEIWELRRRSCPKQSWPK